MKTLLVVLLLLAGCTSSPREHSWIVHDFGSFTLSLPSAFRETKVQGEDSYVGRYDAPGMRIEFDYSLHADPLRYEDAPGFTREEIIVAHSDAVVASWRRDDALPYVAAVHFPVAGSADERLTLYIFSKDQSALPLEIIQSVRLKRQKPNQAIEPTATAVTPRADARVAPSAAVAHL